MTVTATASSQESIFALLRVRNIHTFEEWRDRNLDYNLDFINALASLPATHDRIVKLRSAYGWNEAEAWEALLWEYTSNSHRYLPGADEFVKDTKQQLAWFTDPIYDSE
ncbi:MAG: hypothetical protein JNL32_03955 [Candidatus Kapabacteria bacterium]|nr:hypothetical protein [Candidatus Kapabacteria bacterium]